MTKGEIIQLIKDATGNMFRDRTISLHVEKIWDQYTAQIFMQNPNEHNFYTKSYPDVQVVPVSNTNAIAYSLLPERIVQINDTRKGCREITLLKSPDLKFVPITMLGRKIYPKLEVGYLDKTIGFEVMTDRVLYDKPMKDISVVNMRLCIPFSRWAITDDIPLPSGISSLIIDAAVSSIKGESVPLNVYHKPK